mmetsp:Transcript_34189/g.80507  ORF Transcript_34189/g.80507 Transcript_34189/m.80507 type:complete len:359 (+) Transcript_34189:1821-2897(+)
MGCILFVDLILLNIAIRIVFIVLIDLIFIDRRFVTNDSSRDLDFFLFVAFSTFCIAFTLGCARCGNFGWFLLIDFIPFRLAFRCAKGGNFGWLLLIDFTLFRIIHCGALVYFLGGVPFYCTRSGNFRWFLLFDFSLFRIAHSTAVIFFVGGDRFVFHRKGGGNFGWFLLIDCTLFGIADCSVVVFFVGLVLVGGDRLAFNCVRCSDFIPMRIVVCTIFAFLASILHINDILLVDFVTFCLRTFFFIDTSLSTYIQAALLLFIFGFIFLYLVNILMRGYLFQRFIETATLLTLIFHHQFYINTFCFLSSVVSGFQGSRNACVCCVDGFVVYGYVRRCFIQSFNTSGHQIAFLIHDRERR